MAAGETFEVDSHAHAFLLGESLVADRRYTPPSSRPLEEYLSVLDVHRIQRAVLVQPSFLGTDNSYVLEAIERHPDRLRGVAVVPPDCPPPELEALSQAGIAGLRLNVIETMGPWRLDDQLRAMGEAAAACALHIELHGRGDRLAALIEFLLPTGVCVVVDHFGRPGRDALKDSGFRAMLAAGTTRRLYVKLSAPYRVPFPDLPALALALHDALGADRLMWGSDWPWTQHEEQHRYDELMAMLGIWLPDPADRSWALGKTAASLFRFR